MFVDLTGAREMVDAEHIPSDIDSMKLPTRGVMRSPAYFLRTAARNAGESNLPGALGYAADRLANNKVFGVRTWADRFEAQAGSSFDRASNDISGTQINPADDNGGLDVYRVMRYGLSDRGSKAVQQAYLDGTVAERRTIIKNGIVKMLLTRAHVPIPEDLADLQLGRKRTPAAENYIEELSDGPTKKAILEAAQHAPRIRDNQKAPPTPRSMEWRRRGEVGPRGERQERRGAPGGHP